MKKKHNRSRRTFTYLSILVILSAAFVLLCCGKGRTETLRVNALSGLNLRSEPAANSKVLDLLPHGADVAVLNREGHEIQIGTERGQWAYIEYNDKKGWVFDAFLVQNLPEYFFRVMAVGGLLIRSEPGLNGQKLGLIPEHYVGKIQKTSRHKQTIGQARGYWIETTYDGITGWIFSGFARIARSEYDLTRDRILDVQPHVPDEYTGDFQAFLATGRLIAKKQFRHFDVYQVQHPPDPINESCGPRNRVAFVHRTSGRVRVQEYYAENIESAESLFPETIFNDYVGCCACCPYGGNILYFLGSEEVEALYLSDKQSLTAACDFSPMGLATILYTEHRVAADAPGRLLVFRKLPDCELPSGELENEPDLTLRLDDVKKFLHERYAIVDFDGDELRIEEFRDRGIPATQRKQWEHAQPVESIRAGKK